MIISLIGFMGTGKSTVGMELAKRLDYQFIDTDSEIKKEADKEIKDIFADKGEKYFRKIETCVLEKLLREDTDLVLATGGGIVLSSKNRELLARKTEAFLLEASVEEIYKRVKNDKNRPLLDVEDPLLAIEKILMERKEYYNYFTKKINTDRYSVAEIVEMILDRLEES
ncbi:shikimate kinase [Natronospora cellulosivora (SeqCode)]